MSIYDKDKYFSVRTENVLNPISFNINNNESKNVVYNEIIFLKNPHYSYMNIDWETGRFISKVELKDFYKTLYPLAKFPESKKIFKPSYDEYDMEKFSRSRRYDDYGKSERSRFDPWTRSRDRFVRRDIEDTTPKSNFPRKSPFSRESEPSYYGKRSVTNFPRKVDNDEFDNFDNFEGEEYINPHRKNQNYEDMYDEEPFRENNPTFSFKRETPLKLVTKTNRYD